MSWNAPVTRYHPIHNDQEDGPFQEKKLFGRNYQLLQPQRKSTSSQRAAWAAGIIFLSAVLSLVMFSLGQWSVEHPQPEFSNIDSKAGLDVSVHRRRFDRNQTWGRPSSEASDALWASIQPEQEGFMRHPIIAPVRGAFATFHQLHCLNALRKSYWILHGQSYPEGRAKPVLPEDEFPHMIAPAHMNHCIDLLRNALMCNPDLTFEIEEVPGKGTTGFETEHFCLDWSKIRDFATKWARWDMEERKKVKKGAKDSEKHNSAAAHLD